MSMNEYQEKARTTRLPQTVGLGRGYSALGLNGEAGEVADKVKKIQRGDFDLDNSMSVPQRREMAEKLEAHKAEIVKELGDVLWYVAAMADDLGVTLDLVAQTNLDKLMKRQQDGVIHGNGDNR